MKQLVGSLIAICLFGFETMSQGMPQAPAGLAASAEAEFIIGAEDILEISVWREPSLTARVTVRPDGKIGVPLLNDVQASGLTTMQLQEQITAGLSLFVAEPHVSVIVLEIHSRRVHIMGSVPRPGAYPLGGPLTVVELLARAGGLADFAKSKEIRIIRSEGSTSNRYPFNYNDFMDGKDFKQNLALQSGDIVIVP